MYIFINLYITPTLRHGLCQRERCVSIESIC